MLKYLFYTFLDFRPSQAPGTIEQSRTSRPINQDELYSNATNTEQLYPEELYNLARSQQRDHLDIVNSFIQVLH